MISAKIKFKNISADLKAGPPDGSEFQTLSGTALSVTAPSGAYGAKMVQLGGNSYVSKNLIDNTKIGKGRLNQGVVEYESAITDLTVTATTVSATNSHDYRGIHTDYIPVSANTAYTISCSAQTNIDQALFAMYDSSKTWISNTIPPLTVEGKTITTVADCAWIRISFNIYQVCTATITDLMLEKGSAKTSFEEYGIRSSLVTALKIGSTSYSISSSIQSLDGYGLGISDSVRNYIDFGSGQYVQMVASHTITSDDYDSHQDYTNCIYAKFAKPTDCKGYGEYSSGGLMTAGFNQLYTGEPNVAKNIGAVVGSFQKYNVWYGFTPGTSEDDMKNAVIGKTLVYELASPVKTPISSYIAGNISNYNGITSGGKVTFTSSTNVPPRYSVKFVEDNG